MTRLNGYIDLEKLLNIPPCEDEFEVLSGCAERVNLSNNAVVKRVRNNQILFWFYYNGEKYYFKYDFLTNPLTELIVEELAHDYGIPCISYDLASVGNRKGVISKNYKVKGAKYISGKKILEDFYLQENPNPKDIIESEMEGDYAKAYPKRVKVYMNTLQGIWVALEYRYKDNDDMQIIVSNLMRKIVDLFIFDTLTGQVDRHCTNWEIVEYSNGVVDLQPIYDNARAVMVHPPDGAGSLTVDRYDVSLKTYLSDFFATSSNEFINAFLDKIWIINDDNILSALKRVEEKTGVVISDSEKELWQKRFKVYREFFESYLGLGSKRG